MVLQQQTTRKQLGRYAGYHGLGGVSWPWEGGGGGSSTPDSNKWFELLQTGLNDIAKPILNAQFGGPQPGQYFSTDARGQRIAYSLPAGSSTAAFGVSTTGFGAVLPWVIGGVVVFALFKGLSK